MAESANFPSTAAAGAFDRRTFLDALLTVGFVSTAAAIAYPVSRFLVPPESGEAVTNSVVAMKAAALKPNTGAIFPFGSKPAIVVRSADGELNAFSAVCTHLECTVQFKAGHVADLVRVSQRPLRSRGQRHLGTAAARARAVRRQSARRTRRGRHRRVARGLIRKTPMVQQVVDWLDERLDLSGLKHFIAEKGVPVHTQEIWYYLGGMTLFLFAVQVFTGILLLLYYRPSSAEAYESVQFIVTQVQFGWLIRNIHSWSANLLIGAAFAHFFSVFFLKSYRKPRELTWLTGILLLFLMLGFGFSGYLLPWNELSFFATKVGTGIAGAVPLVGPFHAPPAPRRRRRDRRDAVAVLRAARGRAAGDHHGARRRAPAARAAPGHERAAARREASQTGRARPADAVLPELHPARRAGLVRGARRARRRSRRSIRGSSAGRPTRSPPCLPASGPSGTSSRCSTR